MSIPERQARSALARLVTQRGLLRGNLAVFEETMKQAQSSEVFLSVTFTIRIPVNGSHAMKILDKPQRLYS